eukprot:SAG22_NODE_6748_length_816_cov_1.317992_2_plen_131_part_01
MPKWMKPLRHSLSAHNSGQTNAFCQKDRPPTFVLFMDVQRDIRAARELATNATTFSLADGLLGRANLLALMKKIEQTAHWNGLRHFFKFVQACCSTLITSTIVESLFSQFANLKGKYRASLGDGNAVSSLL